MSRCRAVVAGFLFLVAVPGRSATPVLYGDFNPARMGEESFSRTQPRFLAGVGPRAVLFLGDSFDASTTLWGTDGTPAGTRPVARFEYPFPEPLGVVSGAVLFAHNADPSSFGVPSALWRTDGTPEGTHRLPEVTFPFPVRGQSISFSGSLYFQGCTETAGCELWKSDGTPAGTAPVKDLTPGRYSSDPRLLRVSGGRLFFFATNPDGVGLWVSDGTRAGTRRAARLPLGMSPLQVAAAGTGVAFTVAGQPAREVLWTSDGTSAGTHPLPPFDRAGRAAPVLGELVGGEPCLFTATRAGQRELWATDGTVAGTRRLARFPSSTFFLDSFASAALQGEVFFAGPNAEPWSTRGTPGTTRRLTCAGGCPRLVRLPATPVFAELGGRLLFGGIRDGRRGLWSAAGSDGGAELLAELPGPPRLVPLPAGGRLFFHAGSRLWATDGTGAGTRAVADASFSFNLLAAVAGSRLTYVSQSPTRGFDLRSSDGTVAGSTELVNLERGAGSLPQGFRLFGDRTFFTTCFAGRVTLWLGEGLGAPPAALADAPGFCSEIGDNRLGRPLVVGDEAFFLWIAPGDFWAEVWRTDGTPGGTEQVTHLGPEQDALQLLLFAGELVFTTRDLAEVESTFWRLEGHDPVELFAVPVRYAFNVEVVDDELFFIGEDFQGRPRLFRSDGTAAGTLDLAGVGGRVSPLGRLDGDLFFLAAGSLWRTDGTRAGTRQVLPNPLAGGVPNSFISGTLFNGTLLLIGPDGNGGSGLLHSDGTAAGTTLVAKLLDDPFLIPSPGFVPFGRRLAFAAADATHGAELWMTDGTRENTSRVRDIRLGQEGSGLTGLVSTGGRVFFSADDGIHGVELWESDGTEEGTRLVADLAPGAASSFPRELTLSGSLLFFSAEDGVNGREPWVLETDP